jgi:hypothetical protein
MPSATELNQILTQTVVALARKPVACAVQSTDDAGGLLPDEEALVAKAVERRRSEFAAGRRSARCALATLGCPVRPLMIGALRQPLWPAGFGGSITHDGRYAAAIAWRVSGHAPDLSLDLIDRADQWCAPLWITASPRPKPPGASTSRLRRSANGSVVSAPMAPKACATAPHALFHRQARQRLPPAIRRSLAPPAPHPGRDRRRDRPVANHRQPHPQAPRPQPALSHRTCRAQARYERASPGEIIHLDIKKLGRFNAMGRRITGNRTG